MDTYTVGAGSYAGVQLCQLQSTAGTHEIADGNNCRKYILCPKAACDVGNSGFSASLDLQQMGSWALTAGC